MNSFLFSYRSTTVLLNVPYYIYRMNQRSLNTRKRDDVWLIGFPMELICGARLPSGRDVMRNFVHFHRSEKMTVRESACKVFEQVAVFWQKSRLPIRQKYHITKKIEDLYEEYSKLMKNRLRGNDTDLLRQKEYCEKLDKLFDISHAKADELINIEEDRQFLKLQKESRKGSIGPVDKKLVAKETRTAIRKKKALNRLAAHKKKEEITEKSSSDSEHPTDLPEDQSSDEEFSYTPKAPRKQKSIISPNVAATLDRTNTSVRKSSMIIASVINCAGSTPSGVMSKSTIHRQRKSARQQIAQSIKEQFQPVKGVVHWDGKLLPDIGGSDGGQVDRLAVLITSCIDGSNKLLGVSKMLSGKGKAMADAVTQELESWSCDSVVIGMCFDTTASNTGRLSGACQLIENSLDRNLLWLACRHHMLEVLLADSFTVCFGPSSGPEILLFKRFKGMWFQLNHHKPQLSAEPLIAASDDEKDFILQQLELTHARDDYLELLTLASSMLGLDTDVTIRRPGAMHRARWMAKAIYSLKMELLLAGNESIMKLTARELKGLQRFNRFVIHIYLKAWFTSRLATDAAFNDIELIQRLRSYSDDKLSAAGLKAMQRQSWYLSNELATLTLFSDRISDDEKTQLVLSISNNRGPHLLSLLPSVITDLTMSRSFFSTTFLDDSFLNVPVTEWHHNESYKKAYAVARNLPCVNDCAERGVALIQQFNETTKDEVQKQYLLQVVEKHRKGFKKCNIAELKNI